MKIEMALPTLEIGGMEQMVVTLATGLAARGHAVGVTCLTVAGVLADALGTAGVRVSTVHAPGVLSNLSAPALTEHFRRLAPDVVHTHSGVWGRASRAARKAGVQRTVHTVHGKLDRDPWYDIPLKRWESAHSDYVVAVSDALAVDLRDRIGVPARRLRTLINGIDTTRFHADGDDRLRMRRELELGERPTIGIIARLATVKNHVALLDAMTIVRQSVDDALLLIVGDGPLEAQLRSHADASCPAGSVQFLGPRGDTDRLYRALDLFVLPSHAEGTSISVLEAMATGTPVVATAVGGTPHLLDHGACGSLSRSTSAGDLASAMLDALMNRSAAQTRARLALQRVHDVYSLDSMLTGYEALYTAPAVG